MAARQRGHRWSCPVGTNAITIPASVTALTKRSFRRVRGLEEIQFETGCTIRELVTETFWFCTSLKSICIPRSVELLQSFLFTASRGGDWLYALETLTFEAGSKLVQIAGFAFCGCRSLISICVPASVSDLSGVSFMNSGLREIEIEDANKNYQVSGEYLMAKSRRDEIIRYLGDSSEIHIDDEVEIIGGGCFGTCQSIRRVAFGPASKLSIIGVQAFSQCLRLESVSIPSLVTDLVACCFEECLGLREVTFCADSQLSDIRETAFQYCQALQVINLPSSLVTIHTFAFENCAQLATVTFPPDSELERIQRGAFCACASLRSFTVPASVTFIGEERFLGCRALSHLAFVAPPKIRELLDIPERLVGLQEIPDSVEKLRIGISGQHFFRTVSFGRESKLVVVKPVERMKTSVNRCFLQVSSASLKVFRSTMEFGSN
jgi:hypothetical protein